MAKYGTTFVIFDDVKAWYDATKPMGGASNAGKDIRPLGDRRRKHERIIKISDSCYALSDGYHFGDAEFPNWAARATPVTAAEVEFYCPIVWRKHRDGTETVKVRNGTGPNHSHNARYDFLQRNMPVGLAFVRSGGSGKQFVKIQGVNSTIFLAKGKTLPGALYDRAQVSASNFGHSWGMRYDDGAALLFRRDGTRWQLISHGGEGPAIPRTVVDTKTKKKFKNAILSFRHWTLTMTAMIDLRDWNVRNAYGEQLTEWARENGVARRGGWSAVHNMFYPDTVRAIVSDEEHPMRLALAVRMMHETDMYAQPIRDQHDLTYVNVRLNRWINKAMGFNTTVEK